MTDLARTIAFAFRRKGLDAMPGGDLRLLLAYDLRWFAPEDAKRCVQRAIEVGLLRDEGGMLRPTFDVGAIEIPMNFGPTIDALDEAPGVGLPPAATSVPSPLTPPSSPIPPPSSPLSPPSSIERAAEEERRRRGLRMSLDVARLVVRRRAGEDVTVEAAALEKALLTRG